MDTVHTNNMISCKEDITVSLGILLSSSYYNNIQTIAPSLSLLDRRLFSLVHSDGAVNAFWPWNDVQGTCSSYGDGVCCDIGNVRSTTSGQASYCQNRICIPVRRSLTCGEACTKNANVQRALTRLFLPDRGPSGSLLLPFSAFSSSSFHVVPAEPRCKEDSDCARDEVCCPTKNACEKPPRRNRNPSVCGEK